ncbi:MAG TPA: hypothetical protein VF516_33215 [Kofleriaceae bacterium]
MTIAALVLGTGDARGEDEAATPLNYVVVGVGTTAIHRPSGGPVSGWQHDVAPIVGYGRFVYETIALELDIGPTYVRGDYAGTSLVPGVVWAFSEYAYAAARFVVPVDPELDLGLYPGVGLVHTFQNGIGVFAEGNVFSYVGRGTPDLGVALSAGALYSF